MTVERRATRLELGKFGTPPMRAFHLAWIAFFLCFFAWFGIAPLMDVVREEMKLTKEQLGWCIVGSVSLTVFARLLIGWLCDRVGPRFCYTGLLTLGSLPVMGIALADGFETFLLCRVLIGAIGGSFVITQYHTSVMFAPNCVGTANATAAGWGNLGGGLTQIAMPLLFAFLVGNVGWSPATAWRGAMVIAGVVCFLTGIAYFFLTQDTPVGNFRELRAAGKMPPTKSNRGAFAAACRDRRVWALFVVYGACFGMELTLDNVAALYFLDHFSELQTGDRLANLRTAGLIAGLFGAMNLFARAVGGLVSDRLSARWGVSTRVKWLFLVVFCEGICLILFSQARTLTAAVPALMLTGLFVKMSNGATYAVVPFINRRALGSVSGIVGAGGNVGAVAAGFLFKANTISWSTAFFLLGAMVTVCSFFSLLVTLNLTADESASEPQRTTPAIEPAIV